jgi:hypothetical protein
MRIKSLLSVATTMAIGLIIATGCSKDGLEYNPNAGSAASATLLHWT